MGRCLVPQMLTLMSVGLDGMDKTILKVYLSSLLVSGRMVRTRSPVTSRPTASRWRCCGIKCELTSKELMNRSIKMKIGNYEPINDIVT